MGNGGEIKKSVKISSAEVSAPKADVPIAKVAEENKIPETVSLEAPENVIDANLVSVSLMVFGKSYEEKVEKGTTIFDMMTKLSTDQDFTFKSKEFTGIGQFVNEINGVKAENGKYWILYVNEKEAEVGASDYKLEGGEKIEWKLESGL